VKITKLETFIVNVPYTHDEVSSRIVRGGVTAVIVKLTADNGLVGWGESCGNIADGASIELSVRCAEPFLIGRDPWQKEAIARDFYKRGTWDRRIQSANFAFAGIDHALWDICGKECGQPLYRLFGGAQRDVVDYFYYLSRGTPEEIRHQAKDGVRRGYTCFYLKVGLDSRAEEEMLVVLREAIGVQGKIRIDVNEAWTINQAVRLLRRWDDMVGLDFCEAPVAHDLPESMREIRERVPCAISANEGLGREVDVLRLIRSRCADVLCFSPFWVGSLRRFLTLSHTAHLDGLRICKHTHGELGIAAAAAQHAMLAIPNAIDGNQQTATIMTNDILTQPLPIATGPSWSAIEAPGLGIEVDEEKLSIFREAYRRDGQFVPFRLKAESAQHR
jgi:L-alanine-DL-glutamate epimerase-like enolase superfamily enzyme